MSEFQLVEINSETILNELIQDFENETGELLYPGDERRIFLQNFAPVLVSIKNSINSTLQQNLLRYASGDILTAMALDWFGVTRILAQKSFVTLRFTLSAIQSTDITIPVGTRATPDGIIFFETINPLIISSGNLTGDITSRATEAGMKYNGYTSGQIKIIVDPVAFVKSVSNIDASSGGSDIESDENLRLRTQISPESYSVAGPAGAYEYWAKTADATISDVKVSSPSAGVVKVIVLQEGGQIPNQAILDKVSSVINADEIRPLTDNVQIVAPTTTIYNINFTYYISLADQSNEASIRGLVENNGGAVDRYKSWQCEKIGRDINPDELRRHVLNSGAFRMTITSPTLSTISDDNAAKIGTVTIVYGGLV